MIKEHEGELTPAEKKSVHISKKQLKIRWTFVILLLIGAIINYLDRANLSIANTTISREFGLSSTKMGLLLSAFLWPYAIANLPAGWLVDKFGPKKMFSYASGLWSTVTIISSFISSYPIFYLMRAFLGVAESPFFTAGLKVNQKWFSKKEREYQFPLLILVHRLRMQLLHQF